MPHVLYSRWVQAKTANASSRHCGSSQPRNKQAVQEPQLARAYPQRTSFCIDVTVYQHRGRICWITAPNKGVLQIQKLTLQCIAMQLRCNKAPVSVQLCMQQATTPKAKLWRMYAVGIDQQLLWRCTRCTHHAIVITWAAFLNHPQHNCTT